MINSDNISYKGIIIQILFLERMSSFFKLNVYRMFLAIEAEVKNSFIQLLDCEIIVCAYKKIISIKIKSNRIPTNIHNVNFKRLFVLIVKNNDKI